MGKHVSREELMASAVPVERKDASAGLSVELKGLLNEFQKVGEETKAYVTDQLTEFKKGFKDPLTEEKIAKVLEAGDKLRDEFNAKFAELKRAPGAGDDDYTDVEYKLAQLRRFEAKAFDGFVRRDDREAMVKVQRLAASDEYKAVREAYEQELGVEIKDLSTVIAEDGGYLVLPEYEQDMDEVLLDTSPMRQVANVRQIGSRELIIPVNRKGTAVAWIGETGTRTRTETPNISQQKFTAHEIYALPLVTMAMLEDADFDVESWLHDEVAEALMIEENTRFVLGDGNGKPLGFIHSSITKVANASYDANTNWGSVAYVATGTSGAYAPSYPGTSVGSTTATNGADALLDLVYSLKARFRKNSSFLMSRLTMGETRKLKDGDGQYVVKDAITSSGLLPMLLGYPVDEAEDMPEIAANTYSIAFGDWDKAYQIVDRIGLQVLRDEKKYPGFVEFQFRKRTGGGPRNWDAYKLLKFGTS